MHNIIVILFLIGSTLLQAREKFVSAKKGTRTDAELEEVIVKLSLYKTSIQVNILKEQILIHAAHKSCAALF